MALTSCLGILQPAFVQCEYELVQKGVALECAGVCVTESAHEHISRVPYDIILSGVPLQANFSDQLTRIRNLRSRGRLLPVPPICDPQGRTHMCTRTNRKLELVEAQVLSSRFLDKPADGPLLR